MDSYSYRDSSARSPGDRTWSSRDDFRVKEERSDFRIKEERSDAFYRARSPGAFPLPLSLSDLCCYGIALLQLPGSLSCIGSRPNSSLYLRILLRSRSPTQALSISGCSRPLRTARAWWPRRLRPASRKRRSRSITPHWLTSSEHRSLCARARYCFSTAANDKPGY